MQGAVKEEVCDILGAKKTRPLTIAAVQQIQLRAICRGGTLSQKRIYYKAAHQRVRLSPGPLSQKR